MLEAAPKRFVSGETLPYLGRNVRMVFESGGRALAGGPLRPLALPVSPCRQSLEDRERCESIRRAIVGWYQDSRRRAVRRPASSAGGPGSVGERGRGVLIRDQRQRWGSCAPDGTLRFNWRTMMLPPALIEYVVVHELAHLTHQNHSTDFWGLMTKAMPDAQHRRKRLREAGRTLPL